MKFFYCFKLLENLKKFRIVISLFAEYLLNLHLNQIVHKIIVFRMRFIKSNV